MCAHTGLRGSAVPESRGGRTAQVTTRGRGRGRGTDVRGPRAHCSVTEQRSGKKFRRALRRRRALGTAGRVREAGTRAATPRARGSTRKGLRANGG